MAGEVDSARFPAQREASQSGNGMERSSAATQGGRFGTLKPGAANLRAVTQVKPIEPRYDSFQQWKKAVASMSDNVKPASLWVNPPYNHGGLLGVFGHSAKGKMGGELGRSPLGFGPEQAECISARPLSTLESLRSYKESFSKGSIRPTEGTSLCMSAFGTPR